MKKSFNHQTRWKLHFRKETEKHFGNFPNFPKHFHNFAKNPKFLKNLHFWVSSKRLATFI